MARPKRKMVEACNQEDLIIDVICDFIQKDIVKDPDVKITNDEAVKMRANFGKLSKLASVYYEQQEVEEEIKNVPARS